MNTATKYCNKCCKKIGDKYGNNLMDTAKKQGTNFAKTAGKKLVQKSEEATGNLIGSKIADKINSLGNQKIEKKKMKQIKQKRFTFHQKRNNKSLMT